MRQWIPITGLLVLISICSYAGSFNRVELSGVKTAKSEKKHFLYTGDSIAYGWGNVTPAGEYYVKAHFTSDEVECTNTGKSGDRMADLAARFDLDVIAHKPDVVFIMCGTNNITDGNTFVYAQPSLQEILIKCRNAGIVMAVAEVLPRDGEPQTQYDSAIEGWNAALEVWCNANNVILLRCHDALVLSCSYPRPDPACFFDVPAKHPNNVGNIRVARAFWQSYQMQK
ncbi:MAG: SGNH/GDSL hydrolase family protein [Candidatus Auribacter fodinae]|jgi:lysophospholipase L1-like esterase|uniref:SGNH/GDSL hydrolase family protein n=1 Tax=Candidatus Auribacter fodinae TaxID=2093366 RepID=A0A3A4R6J5_9BACT|nr:MAG: SGNH/GDSL hydrolase family protein [Candidatus Auribacter fodinae]